MLHRVAAKGRKEIKGTTEQKMARQHNKEGGDHLEQEGTDRGQWKVLMEGYILQWMDKAKVKGENLLQDAQCHVQTIH